MLLRSHYVADLIKKLEFHLMVVSVLLKGKFWARPNKYAQNQYTHVKRQPSSTPPANYPKGEPVVYFEKMHVYV